MLCFAHAGASVLSFGRWQTGAPPALRVVGIETPGHGSRGAEPVATDLSSLVRSVLGPVLHCARTARRTVLYGHSLGSLAAFEVARAMQGQGRAADLLVVSGRNAPTLAGGTGTVHDLPLDEFRSVLEGFGAVDATVWSAEGLAEVFVPLLRADLALAERYRYRPGALLTCPIVSVQGAVDPLVTRRGAQAWAAETSAATASHVFAGGHMFPFDAAGKPGANIIGPVVESLAQMGPVR